MKFLRLRGNIFIRLILIVISFLVQSCSNTVIGNKLENSFDREDRQTFDTDITQEKVEGKVEVKKLKRIKSDQNIILGEKNIVQLEKDNRKIRQQKDIKKKDEKLARNQDLEKFKPQPYRIILKLSGANPSAPAETVTKALRKAGVKFEVEKIERFNGDLLLENPPSKRKEF
mgnify:CR=1 FL=1